MSEIQVSGLQWFNRTQWRDALLYFVNGIMANWSCVTYRPKIDLEMVSLRLHPKARVYTARIEPAAKRNQAPTLKPQHVLETSCQQEELERALLRFVKDDAIHLLRVWFVGPHGDCALVFWKQRVNRGFLGIAAEGLWDQEDFDQSFENMRTDLAGRQ